jgi:hypothetical protein
MLDVVVLGSAAGAGFPTMEFERARLPSRTVWREGCATAFAGLASGSVEAEDMVTVRVRPVPTVSIRESRRSRSLRDSTCQSTFGGRIARDWIELKCMRSGGHWTTLGLLLRRGGCDNGRPGINYTLSDAGRSSLDLVGLVTVGNSSRNRSTRVRSATSTMCVVTRSPCGNPAASHSLCVSVRPVGETRTSRHCRLPLPTGGRARGPCRCRRR